MVMYTEIYINVDLKKETPDDVIQVLKAMCEMLSDEEMDEVMKPYPECWMELFSSCSYYTPNTYCKFLEFDDISEQWSLLGKGDIKNYGNEIREFFKWIMPYIDSYPGEFIGYSRHEEDKEPELYFYPQEDT